MTTVEKQQIAVLRSQGQSYKAIADALHLSINTVKTYCRRNHLTGVRADENLSAVAPEIDLLPVENRGNTVTAERPGSLENTGSTASHPTYRVKLLFSEQGDENAIPDALGMLMNVHCRQG